MAKPDGRVIVLRTVFEWPSRAWPSCRPQVFNSQGGVSDESALQNFLAAVGGKTWPGVRTSLALTSCWKIWRAHRKGRADRFAAKDLATPPARPSALRPLGHLHNVFSTGRMSHRVFAAE